MTFISSAAKTCVAAIVLTSLGLVAALPAQAHTNLMFTRVFDNEATDLAAYATYGKADGHVEQLPTTYPVEDREVAGIEIVAEQGYEVGYFPGPYIRKWNHITGVADPQMPMFLTDHVLNGVRGLDTLPDGSLAMVAGWELPSELEAWTIASINPTTGLVTPLVEFTDKLTLESNVQYDVGELATDPTSGITYVVMTNPITGSPYFLTVDVANKVVGDPVEFEPEFFGSGGFGGVDFDADGTLYFNYANLEKKAQLGKFTNPPSTWSTVAPVEISTAPGGAQYGTVRLSFAALTIEQPALAATGSALPMVAIVLVGTLAVLTGGVTIAVARRRREAGTV